MRRLHLRAEHGFTLAELSVTMLAGVVVIGALFTIMIVTLHQTQRTFTRVDATRRARTTFAKIENLLHSACIDGSAPIQATTGSGATLVPGSDSNNLVLLSFYGTSANPSPVWHQITYDPAGLTLTDKTYTATYTTVGSTSDWVRGTSTATTTLLTNVSQSGTTPVFQYYAYKQYADANNNLIMLIPDGTNKAPITGTPDNLPLGTSGVLSVSDANSAVEVVTTLRVGASSGGGTNTSLHTLDDSVSDTVSLRLTTPPNYVAGGVTSTDYGPCM